MYALVFFTQTKSALAYLFKSKRNSIRSALCFMVFSTKGILCPRSFCHVDWYWIWLNWSSEKGRWLDDYIADGAWRSVRKLKNLRYPGRGGWRIHQASWWTVKSALILATYLEEVQWRVGSALMVSRVMAKPSCGSSFKILILRSIASTSFFKLALRMFFHFGESLYIISV